MVFRGWGEHAPVKGRRIVNQWLRPRITDESVSFRADNTWEYACEQTLADGKQIGAAVLNHPKNPPTLWHNHPDIRMINPCIVATAEVELKGGKPLGLR